MRAFRGSVRSATDSLLAQFIPELETTEQDVTRVQGELAREREATHRGLDGKKRENAI
jgi:hypothetical protein